MDGRYHCKEILAIIPTFKAALEAPLEGITPDLLNQQLADHKMSIGQLAIHCTAWMTYFLTEPKPWQQVDWTCKPVEYPLDLSQVQEIIDEGFERMIQVLEESTDEILEVDQGKKGHGYIIVRLLHHVNAHSNQMSYLRQLEDPNWGFGSHFGDMATALINLDYSTTRDLSIPGF